MNKRIITVAPTGAWPTKKENPNVPLRPAEIADEVYGCWKEGAAVCHIHVRDDDSRPTMDLGKFEETVRLIRARKDCDIIVNLTTSGGINLKEDDRCRPFFELRPEMATFDCGSMNWQHSAVFENHPLFLERIGAMMQDSGVKPEIETFDPGMIYNAGYYLRKGVLKAPLHFQFCMGVPGGIKASAKNLVFMKDTMDEVAPGSTWSAFGVGAGAMEILYSGVAMGGHVRVGMEDNVMYRKGQPADGNRQFVARARRVIEEFGCDIATPAEARQILGLSPRA
ncbi:MAG: 3-keto-5-aminohexanoate cleavage protein [Spirochaetes bacterium]|nr:3-keto-5-aminohexanoate cleavage protein [Spirochaetota bacterium]MBU1080453.1 3-keto-5-aminohexanoate cleavage protein [Spirochaetota bacterium]